MNNKNLIVFGCLLGILLNQVHFSLFKEVIGSQPFTSGYQAHPRGGPACSRGLNKKMKKICPRTMREEVLTLLLFLFLIQVVTVIFRSWGQA